MAVAPGSLTVAELRAELDGDVPPRILDVRTPAEFETVHIPGAYSVPLDVLREHRDELVRRLDEDVVLVCASGQRARQAERAFEQAGLPRVHVLDGGMQSWEAAGGPVRRGQQRWAMERQVRLVAGSLVLGSGIASLRWPRAKWLGTAVGGGLVFAAVSNTCMMASLLGRLPYNRAGSDACDIDTLVAHLAPDTASE